MVVRVVQSLKRMWERKMSFCVFCPVCIYRIMREGAVDLSRHEDKTGRALMICDSAHVARDLPCYGVVLQAILVGDVVLRCARIS